MRSDTIAAIATASGRAGVAVIRVSGPDAFEIASRVTGRNVSADDAGRFFHCVFKDPSLGVSFDDGLLLVFAAPRSYTGEDVVEFQVHGGSVVPRRMLEAAFASGAVLARRGEFTERAFLNGRLGLSEAEAVIDLIDAKTDRAADDAARRLSGDAARRFDKLYLRCVELSGRMEHSLDFSEDELPAEFFTSVKNDLDSLASEVAGFISTAREGRMLREGVCVVLAGAPNAGKSSLLNALLGEDRAIVTDIPGTTRDFIEEGLVLGGWPVRLIDTAGLRDTDDTVEAEGVSRSEALIAEADVVLALDCDLPGAIRVHSKADVASGEGINVSSKTGEGLDDLRDALVRRFEELAAHEGDVVTDVTTREKDFLLKVLAHLKAASETDDLVIAANEVREAGSRLAELLGKTYVEDMLDAVFSRFCVGK